MTPRFAELLSRGAHKSEDVVASINVEDGHTYGAQQLLASGATHVVVRADRTSPVTFQPTLPGIEVVAPILKPSALPDAADVVSEEVVNGWLFSSDLLLSIFGLEICPTELSFTAVVDSLRSRSISFRTWSAPASFRVEDSSYGKDVTTGRDREVVLAFVPHFRCIEWLPQALESLLAQTRIPDHIVVVNDGPECLPLDVVLRYPTVSLYASDRRAGPFALVDQMWRSSEATVILVQDADDWSAADRLERQLQLYCETGSELIGTQEFRFGSDNRACVVLLPQDANSALAFGPGHFLLHGSSLIATSLLTRLGGWATGLPFAGDSELLMRAVFDTRVLNLSDVSYFRRIRPDALTRNANSGFGSETRSLIWRNIAAKALCNMGRIKAGKLPDLRPLVLSSAINLCHIAGPRVLRL
jgi:hypothetical protein